MKISTCFAPVLCILIVTFGHTVLAGDVQKSETAFTTNLPMSSLMQEDDVPLVELRPAQCGIDNYTTNNILRATQPVSGTDITAYEWRFVELEAPFNTYEIISPNGSNPNFRLLWFPQVQYNRNYDVSVRIYETGVPGAYGNVCEIGLQTSVLTTRLQQQFANGLFNFCSVVGADAVGAASQYRWTFDDFDVLLEAFGNGTSRLLRLREVPGIQLGQIYIVRVYATVGGVESPAGTPRFINMNNFVPNTGLNSALFPCGATYPINTQVQAVEICDAESYTWRFRNTSSTQADIFYTRDDGSRFIRLDWITDFNLGDSYDVDVRASQGGLMGDFSTVCNITIEASTAGLIGSSDPVSLFTPNTLAAETDLMGLNLQANQVSGKGSDMNVIITNPVSERPVQLSLFDMSGRLVSQRQEAIFDQATITWPTSNLNTGIYILRAENGLEVTSYKIAIF